MLAENLKSEREKRGWSQEKVAEQIGVTRALYGYYELGLKVPTLVTTLALAKLYETTVEELTR
ncbi:MAG: helix-turn-helix domain-containing protein [Clostridia bacterium]|nr:helix-turn-helix domain-containing protein [Clostridia bacterium]